CVFRCLERDLDVALSGKIVDLVGSCLLHNSDQVGRVGQVAVMQGETHVLFVRILIQMVHPASVEGGGTTLNTVNDVTLVEQEFRKICTILPSSSRNQRNTFCH